MMGFETLLPQFPLLCALMFLAVVVMVVASCVCFKDSDKTPEYGTAGRLSITKDSPILRHQPGNGAVPSAAKHTEPDDGNTNRNSWTLKDRALPEIPGSVNNQNSEHGTNTTVVDSAKAKSHSKSATLKSTSNDPSKVFPVNGTALPPTIDGGSGVTVTIIVNDKAHVVRKSPTTLDQNAQKRLASTDSLPEPSTSKIILRKIEKVVALESPERSSSSEGNLYDSVLDSPIQRRSQTTSESSSPARISRGNLDDDANTSNVSASLAVAGGVPSSDIPYMTPPLAHNLPPSIVDEQVDQNASGVRAEVPYTVISVREPLARVREITMRRQKAVAQQSSGESDDHYAMVPEEEQMYAEIGSGASSLTYAHIGPRELPPVPPTVESLKSVAHAHSRQASTVSTSSFGSCVSSPGESSPPVLRNSSTPLYSTVEKSSKQRKTIHIAEGASLANSAEKRKKVEDMYAKVRKKRTDLIVRTSSTIDDHSGYQGIQEDISCVTPPPSPWASTTPPAPPPICGRLSAMTLTPGNPQHIRRHSADPNLPEVVSENRIFEPNYERIYNEDNSGDSCYEKIKDNDTNVDDDDNIWLDPPSTSVGYASVKGEEEDSLDPGYECVAQLGSENDPGYEPVRVSRNFDDSDSNSDYTMVKLDDNSEPGYERVRNPKSKSDDVSEPGYERVRNPSYGYEKIKKMPRRAESDATDPGYAKVKKNKDDISEPGYESLHRSDSDTDPMYEVVQQPRPPVFNRYSSRNLAGMGNQIASSSTVLYVPGRVDVQLSSDSSSQDESMRSSLHGTFL